MRDKATFSSVQLLSPVRLFVTSWTATHQASSTSTSTTPGDYSNSCPSCRWYHPTISSSVVPFSSHLQFLSIRVFSNELVLCNLQICVLQTFIKKQKTNRECKDYIVLSFCYWTEFTKIWEQWSLKWKCWLLFLANTPLTSLLSTLFLL